MKKITDFIIEKRYFILVLFLFFTVISFILSDHVQINYDISRYLPNSSETKQGIDLMDEEFSNVETSTLEVMFQNLTEEEKANRKSALESIDGVKSVSYDNSEKYNKDSYSLYEVTINDKKDSDTAKNVYQTIEEQYQDDFLATSGEVDQANKTVLPFWILALAVFCAFIILMIMCESFVEPFLFLFTILMAVIFNKGTNIIFPSVSHITDSICAILQMALSMDYSIMLMHRYDQEKQKEKDKVKAMKNALHKSFLSISSSSVTTIVGLLALVFMSFTIGKDLGFVLAKGVFFSLLSIFFVLPTLILIFDSWIVKTKKKVPPIHFTWLEKLSYRWPFCSLVFFIGLFIFSFVMKGNLGIFYTEVQSDVVREVFPLKNQMAILYPNSKEEQMEPYISSFLDNENIQETLSYGNTLNQKLPVSKLNAKLDELGSTVEIQDYLLKILYYDSSYQKDIAISFADFITFLEQEVYLNSDVHFIDAEMKENVNKLKNFVLPNQIVQKKTASDIAKVLDISPSQMNDLLVYYFSLNTQTKLSLNDFVSFLKNDVAHSKYASEIDQESQQKLLVLENYINENTLKQKMDSSMLAHFFQIDEETIQKLFQYFFLKNDVHETMRLFDFAHFMETDIFHRPEFSSSFDENMILQIQQIAFFSDENEIFKERSGEELAQIFGIPFETVKQVLFYNTLSQPNESKYRVLDFVQSISLLQETTPYLKELDGSFLNDLQNSHLMESEEVYTVEEMAHLTHLPSSQVNLIYHLIDSLKQNEEPVMSPYLFVSSLLQNFAESLDETSLQNLKQIQMIMDSYQTQFTYKELSQTLSFDGQDIKNIYILYASSKATFTPVEFVNFLLSCQNDPLLSQSLSKEMISHLNDLQKIMTSVLHHQVYDCSSIASVLGISKEKTTLLYGIYDFYQTENQEVLSFQDFVSFLLKDTVQSKLSFDSLKIKKLTTLQEIMENSLKNQTYLKEQMYSLLHVLSDTVSQNQIEMLYLYYGSSKYLDPNTSMTVEEFVRYLNDVVLKDERYQEFIDEDMKKDIVDAKKSVSDAKELLVGNHYSRIVLNTNYPLEDTKTFAFIENLKKDLAQEGNDFYIIGDSAMAHEMSQTFDQELDMITVITMIFIFVVVLFTFRSVIIPVILVFIIQCSVYLTMGILSMTGESVYFISLLIVQSILMGATIDYAILFTSYYLENRKTMNIKEAIVESYRKSLPTIFTSSSILILVTLIIAVFTSAIAAKICRTISFGTLCSTILILVLLPSILVCFDSFIVKRKK